MAASLHGSVVVITGASSGIGRAAALMFARRGARLVLASRSEPAVKQVADECRRRGSHAIGVVTDITDEDQVKALAKRAIDEFGRINVWVNNAGVVLFGRFLDVPAESFRRVLETNFFGTVNGARAALPEFTRQGSGVLIEVASVLGKEGIPYLSSYVASKEAIIGFSACLREEFKGQNIHVCTILPSSIDTPIWQHGGNYMEHATKPIRPIYDPEDVARAIVKCAERPQRIVYVGAAGRLVTWAHTLSPSTYERIASRVIDRAMFQLDVPAQQGDGNLFAPSQMNYVHGGWKSYERRPWTRALTVAAGLMGAASLMWSLRPRGWSRVRAAKTMVRIGRKLAA